MESFNSHFVAAVVVVGLGFICHAVGDQKCGIDEYFERNLDMCKPCTEVCRPGDKSCEKLCPSFIIQKQLKELLANYSLLQTETRELAGSEKKWRTAVIVLIPVFVALLTLAVIVIIWMYTKRFVHNGNRPREVEENNVMTTLAPTGWNRGPPSPDVVPMPRQGYFSMHEEQRGTEQMVDTGQETDPKHTSIGPDRSNETERTYIAATSSIRDEVYMHE